VSLSIPNDLVPLPTMPYHERPEAIPLTVDEARTALWRTQGNITQAAQLLKVTSLRLRRYIAASPRLTAEMNEAKEQMVDIAEEVVMDALTDTTDNARRDSMAKFVLNGPGKARGWGSGGAKVSINNQGGTVIVGWADGSDFSQPFGDGNTIEHEAAE
jgi:hypothetical protein